MRLATKDLLQFAVVIAIAIGIIIIGISQIAHYLDDDEFDPFESLELFPIELEQDGEPVRAGGWLRLHNGICNKDDREIAIGLFAYIQREEATMPPASPPQSVNVTGTFPILGTDREHPETITLRRCIGTESTRLRMPADAPPGDYILTVIVSQAVNGEIRELPAIVSPHFPLLAADAGSP